MTTVADSNALICAKSKDLAKSGLTEGSKILLKTRLRDIWGDVPTPASTTEYRRARARRNYTAVQEIDNHLFLSYVLVISPTECSTKKGADLLLFLRDLKDLTPYHFSLDNATKKFFSSFALESGLSSNEGYLKFMADIFPDLTDQSHGGTKVQNERILSEALLTVDLLASSDDQPTVPAEPRKRRRLEAEYERERSASPRTSENCRPQHAVLVPSQTHLNFSTTPPALVTTIEYETQSELSNGAVTPGGNLVESSAAQSQVYEEPMLRKLPEVFEHYMCSAVRRIKVRSDDGMFPSKASVTMVFPPWALVDCLMSVDVDAKFVDRLAQTLLGVRVESGETIRYVYWPSGARMALEHDIKLHCISEAAILEVFGPQIYDAVITCRMRKKEADEGIKLTECVSILISAGPHDGAIVNLALGLEQGHRIRKKLYA